MKESLGELTGPLLLIRDREVAEDESNLKYSDGSLEKHVASPSKEKVKKKVEIPKRTFVKNQTSEIEILQKINMLVQYPEGFPKPKCEILIGEEVLIAEVVSKTDDFVLILEDYQERNIKISQITSLEIL